MTRPIPHLGDCAIKNGHERCDICTAIRRDPRRYEHLLTRQAAAGMRRAAELYPCRHRGADTGRTAACTEGCGKGVQTKVFACAVHGDCTIGTRGAGIRGRCRECPERQPEEAPIYVTMPSNGIGDHLIGLTTVAGLRRQHPDRKIYYVVRCDHRWLDLFDAADGLFRSVPDQNATVVQPYEMHGQEYTDKPRAQFYADRAGTTPVLPPLKPLPQYAVDWASPYAGAVVLCPFAYHISRRWPLHLWLALEALLLARGETVVVIGGPNCDNTPFATAHKIKAEEPAKIAAILKGARHYAGNDTGMSHLAGLIGTPSVVVCAHPRGTNIFACYPGVRAINGPLSAINLNHVVAAL